ncbi:FtsX-like permease family protein [Patescibacteria group bacterium]|nr:FtsX-like permease family protein [Patescibacteria group bacterium]
MKFGYINKINIKKLKIYKGKSLFLILPITLLMMLGVVVSSQAQNIQDASEEAIFGTAAEAGRLIELISTETVSTGGNVDFRALLASGDAYTETDLGIIKNIPSVDAAFLPAELPISLISTSDLFDNKEISIGFLTSLDDDLAGLYTENEFNYTSGEPIPVILSANTLINRYEDWNGQTEVAIDVGGFRRGGDNISAIENNSPIKAEAVPYNRDELLGTEFTMNFGGLAPIQDYEQEFTGSGILFKKLSEETVQEQEDARLETISTYWDYDALEQPLSYTFVVVGVLEDVSSRVNYIPAKFASKLMSDYIQSQLDARTEADIPLEQLNDTFIGMSYDGLELAPEAGTFGGFRFGGFGRGRGTGIVGISDDAEEEVTASYTIPGLVIETERETGDSDAFAQRIFGSSAAPLGILTTATIYDEAIQSANTIIVRVDNVANRGLVVEALNDAGYAFQDLNDQEVFTELQATLAGTKTVLTISFIILTGVIIILTMGKFVSESRKEIGVLRAIGATKGDIKKLFMSQAILYTLISYIIGAMLGIGSVLLLAKPIQLWFDNFIESTVDETFNVVQATSAGVFTNINWQMFGIYTVLLIVIALIVSIIPATRASRVSPVQAIKNE